MNDLALRRINRGWSAIQWWNITHILALSKDIAQYRKQDYLNARTEVAHFVERVNVGETVR